MPKRSRPPPAAAMAAMPQGQAFRRSSTAKKQKVDRKVATEAPPARAAKKGPSMTPKAPKAAQPKSILKTNGGAAKQVDSDDEADRFVQQTKGKQRQVERPQSKAKPHDRAQAASPASQAKPKRKSTAPVRPARIPKSFRVVVGSYERMLFGFHVRLHEPHGNDDDDKEGDGAAKHIRPTFSPMFSFAAHTSCISAVAAAGSDSKWLATGAADETVRVWDLRKRKEVGGLTGHGGTIHSLSFPMRTYLLSADSSGLINLYRTRDWALLKTLRGHTGRVNACKAHPSGKVALSVGQDGMLRMWDLMRGKGSGAVKLFLGQEEVDDDDEEGASKRRSSHNEEPLDVEWSPNGKRLVVFGRREVAVYTTAMAKLASVVVRHDDPKSKFGCFAWLDDSMLLCGTESGAVDVYAINESTGSFEGPICKLMGHSNRVKAIRVIEVKPFEETLRLVVTASSDGKIRLYDLTKLVDGESQPSAEKPDELHPIGTHDTGGARLTCLDIVGGAGVRTAAADTIETDVEADMDDAEDDDDGTDGSDDDDAELDADEVQELNDLLDVIDAARAQGIDVEGMSDLDDLVSGVDSDEEEEEEDLEEEEEEEEED